MHLSVQVLLKGISFARGSSIRSQIHLKGIVMSSVELVDPREAYVKPPFKQQSEIEIPGKTKEMNPRPDHGEDSYRGNGKLKGLTSIITGSDSGIGRAIAIAYAREGANVVIVFNESTQDAEQNS